MDHFKSFIDKYGILKEYDVFRKKILEKKRDEPKNYLWHAYSLEKDREPQDQRRYENTLRWEESDVEDGGIAFCRYKFKTPSMKRLYPTGVSTRYWVPGWGVSTESIKGYLRGKRGWADDEDNGDSWANHTNKLSDEDVRNFEKGRNDWLYIRDRDRILSILYYILEDGFLHALELLCSINTPEMTEILSQKMYWAEFDSDELYMDNVHKHYRFCEARMYTPLEYVCKHGHAQAFDILANRLGLTWTDGMRELAFMPLAPQNWGLREWHYKVEAKVRIRACYADSNLSDVPVYFEEFLKRMQDPMREHTVYTKLIHKEDLTDDDTKRFSKRIVQLEDGLFRRLLERYNDIFGYKYFPELFSSGVDNVRENIDAFIKVRPSFFKPILSLLDIEYNLFVGRFVWLQGRLNGNEKSNWEKNFTFFIDHHKDNFYCHLAYQDFLDYDKSKDGILDFELSMINSQRGGIGNYKKSPRDLLKMYDHWHELHEKGEAIYPDVKKYIDGMTGFDDITIVDTGNYGRDVKPHIDVMKKMNTDRAPLCYFGPDGAENNISSPKYSNHWFLAKNKNGEVVAFLAYRIDTVSFYIAWEASNPNYRGNNKPLKILVLAKAIDQRVSRMRLDLCGGHWLSNPSARKVDSAFGFRYLEDPSDQLDMFLCIIQGRWKDNYCDELVGDETERKNAIETIKTMNLCPVTFRKKVILSEDKSVLNLYNIIRKKFYLEWNGARVKHKGAQWTPVKEDPLDKKKMIIEKDGIEKSVAITATLKKTMEIDCECNMELDDLNVSHLVHMFNVVMNSAFRIATGKAEDQGDISMITNFNRINWAHRRRMSIYERPTFPASAASSSAPTASSSAPTASSSTVPVIKPRSPPSVRQQPERNNAYPLTLTKGCKVITKDDNNMFQEANVIDINLPTGSRKHTNYEIKWKRPDTKGTTKLKTRHKVNNKTYLYTAEEFEDKCKPLMAGVKVIVWHIKTNKKRKRDEERVPRRAKIIDYKYPNQYKVEYETDGTRPAPWYHNFFEPSIIESTYVDVRRLYTHEGFVTEAGKGTYKTAR